MAIAPGIGTGQITATTGDQRLVMAVQEQALRQKAAVEVALEKQIKNPQQSIIVAISHMTRRVTVVGRQVPARTGRTHNPIEITHLLKILCHQRQQCWLHGRCHKIQRHHQALPRRDAIISFVVMRMLCIISPANNVGLVKKASDAVSCLVWILTNM